MPSRAIVLVRLRVQIGRIPVITWKNICGEDVMILIIITIRSDKVFHLKSHCRKIRKTPGIQFHVMELATGAGAETSASFAQHFDQRGCLTKHFLELGLIPCFASKLHDDLLIS